MIDNNDYKISISLNPSVKVTDSQYVDHCRRIEVSGEWIGDTHELN